MQLNIKIDLFISCIIIFKDYYIKIMALFNRLFKCTHIQPISIFCNECWVAEGLSSRLIEKQMKGIKTIGFLQSSHPRDSNDFERCVDIVNKNNWKFRLNEMRSYGYVWERIISNWNTLETLLDNNQRDKVNEMLSWLDVIGGKLKRFDCTIHSFSRKTDYVIGSTLVQPCLQSDESDVSPCVILKTFPNSFINYYKSDGQLLGTKIARYTDKFNLEEKQEKQDSPLTKSILKLLDTFVKSNTEQWFSSSFNICHHYVFDDLSDSQSVNLNKMYFAQVYQLDESDDIGYCLISIPPSHPLNPELNTNDTWMIEYQGYKWVVSPQPVKVNTLYLTDGLLNACEDIIQPIIDSDSKLDKIQNDIEQKEIKSENKPINLG